MGSVRAGKAAALLAVALMTGCGVAVAPDARSPSASPRRTSVRPVQLGRASVFGRARDYTRVYVTGTALYVGWQVPPFGSSTVRSYLARVDRVTGKVQVQRAVAGALGPAVSAAGYLWVGTSELLLRLDPSTLAVTRQWLTRNPDGPAATLAVAGGSLWYAAGGTLIRRSLPSGRVTRSILLPGAAMSDLSADASGTVLIVGESNASGQGAVQRRDPVTGALLATSAPISGVTGPFVAGPADGSVWISVPTGMLGYVQRLDAATLRPTGTCTEGRTTSTCVTGTNGVMARIADGTLWITQLGIGPERNYCADPATGRRLGQLPLSPPYQDNVLAIGGGVIYYTAAGPGALSYLRRLQIPPACNRGQ